MGIVRRCFDYCFEFGKLGQFFRVVEQLDVFLVDDLLIAGDDGIQPLSDLFNLGSEPHVVLSGLIVIHLEPVSRVTTEWIFGSIRTTLVFGSNSVDESFRVRTCSEMYGKRLVL